MTKTAKVKKFKLAFIKPKAPDKDSVKLKTEMEKAVNGLGKGKLDQTDLGKVITNNATALRNKGDAGKQYLSDLLSYKVTKHWNEPKELDMWARFCGNPQEVVTAIEKVLGTNPSAATICDLWRKCYKLSYVTELCYKLYPNELVAEAVKWTDEAGATPMIASAPFKKKVAAALYRQGKVDKAGINVVQALDADDATEFAEADPKKFVETFLKNDAQPVDKMEFMKNPKVRAAIKKGSGKWDELKTKMPMLGFLEKVEDKTKTASKAERNSKVADAIFAELLDPKGSMKLTYYTNSLVPAVNLMSTPYSESQAKVDKQRSDMEKVKDPALANMPEEPCMQCDDLVKLLSHLCGAALDGAECKPIVIPGMVLTKKMSEFPGGLLKSTFGGNVYDDTDKLTGQVLFTGNSTGKNPNAHTVFDIAGEMYDAVLGTRGKADVEGAVAEQFGQWEKCWYDKDNPKKLILVAKSKSAERWVVNMPGLKAAPNKHGFNSAYRITTDLSKFVVKGEVKDDEI